MFFVIFDVEAAYLYAWAVAVPETGCYHEPPAWEQMMRNAMQKDFSWDRSGEKYLAVYRRILAHAPVA